MTSGAAVGASVRRKAIRRTGLRVLVTAGIAMSVACGELTRQGTASSYLVVTELVAAPGADPSNFGGVLFSDVVTEVDEVMTVFSDLGRVSFSLQMKDAGSTTSPSTPTSNNYITLNRYRVRYIRTDGRNIPGVDVPFGFDGAITVTVITDMSASFELVRHIAKREAPLFALRRAPTILGTIAEVTFYGHDQTGREVSAVAQMTVQFGDFADPD